MTETKQVVIVGGGISGLTSAFYVKKYFAENGIPVRITIVEKSERMGGKIQTLRRDGFVIEKGPDSFLARKLAMVDLTRDLGIMDELVGTDPGGKTASILHEGKLHPMPKGLVLGIPTELEPFLASGLVSEEGKARALLDLELPPEDRQADESLGDFIERRLGAEVLDHIAEPLLAGIYAGDTHKLSLRATFPQFGEAERKHGSLIKGMMENRKQAAVQEAQDLPEAAQNSMFLSYRRGLSTIVESLLEGLADVNMINGQAVLAIRKSEGTETGRKQPYEIVLEDGETLAADAVIAGLPAFALSRIFPEASGVAQLENVRYVSVANVIMAFNREDVGHPLNGSGFVIPRKEGRFITACTWTSSKWAHTAPKGKALIRCYVGRSGEEDRVLFADEELAAKVLEDIRGLHAINGKPLFTEITRLQQSMPQYPVGHLDTIGSVRSSLAERMPNIKLIGAAFNGVGIPDCIRQGREAADQLCREFAACNV